MSIIERLNEAVEYSEFYYLSRAADLCQVKGWGFGLEDIAHLEAIWRLSDGDCTSFGVIAQLRNGTRLYFDYSMYPDDEDMSETVTMQPMADELYPKLEAIIPGWERDVDHLNRRLVH